MSADQSQCDWAIGLIVMSGVTLPLSISSSPQFEGPVVPIPAMSVRADIAYSSFRTDSPLCVGNHPPLFFLPTTYVLTTDSVGTLVTVVLLVLQKTSPNLRAP
jgi:hypothetical protein